jgi:hypothetical protein
MMNINKAILVSHSSNKPFGLSVARGGDQLFSLLATAVYFINLYW